MLDLAELGVDDEPGDQGPGGRRGAGARPAVQGDDVDRGRRRRRRERRRRPATVAARRPRGAAGRREVPGADQVRHAGLEHAARGPRTSRRDRLLVACSTTHRTASPERAAGAAIRRLGHALVGHEADAELLDEVAATLDDADRPARRRRATPTTAGVVRRQAWTDRAAARDRRRAYDDRPFSGRSQPVGARPRGAPPRRRDRGAARRSARPTRARRAAPTAASSPACSTTCSASCSASSQQPAFTGELTVRYERPTPLHRPLACRGRLGERDGRKMLDRGRAGRRRDGDDGPWRGLFIAVDRRVFRVPPPAPPDERFRTVRPATPPDA